MRNNKDKDNDQPFSENEVEQNKEAEIDFDEESRQAEEEADFDEESRQAEEEAGFDEESRQAEEEADFDEESRQAEEEADFDGESCQTEDETDFDEKQFQEEQFQERIRESENLEAEQAAQKVLKQIKKKNIKKVFRTIFEVCFLFVIVTAILIAVFDWETYEPVSVDKYTYDNGFITVSYFGVDRTRKPTLIDDDMLEKHLEAMKNSGYVTISQQDILDYMKNGKKLPEKAMYLVFEDGRRDSSLFSQPILEKLNYKATMMTYANKFVYKDNKFLTGSDLLDMQDSTFWELGSNGYRFEYINVFDRYNNFVGNINQDQYNEIVDYMEDDYNHYLMDFIRDKDRISIETREQMEERLCWDYTQIDKLYKENIEFTPSAYMIMHANGLDNDSNEIVRNVNFREAKKIFDFMYTREGESVSSKGDDLFNLTRMQALPYWYTNHLLMRIKEDTGNDMAFIHGEPQRAEKWTQKSGEAEFDKNVIALTSPPDEEGLIFLSDSSAYSDYRMSVTLDGNVIGQQSVYLRSSDNGKNFIRLRLKDNIMYVEQANGAEPVCLAEFNLRDIDDIKPVSDEEMRKLAQIDEQELVVEKVLYTEEEKQAQKILKEKQSIVARTVEEGAEEYIPDFGVNDIGKRNLFVVLKGESLDLTIDKKYIGNVQLGAGLKEGYFALGSERSEYNIRDSVYDAVFTDLLIYDINDEKRIFYDNRLEGKEKAKAKVNENVGSIIDWFIENL